MGDGSAECFVIEDKDLGELVCVRQWEHPCTTRFVGMRVAQQVAAMRDLIERHWEAMRMGT